MPVAALVRMIDAYLVKYSDDQPCDEQGRFGSDGSRQVFETRSSGGTEEDRQGERFSRRETPRQRARLRPARPCCGIV